MSLLYFLKSGFNLVVLGLSTYALATVITFSHDTSALKFESAPKALLNLQEIFLPPLVNLQTFVLIFDALIGLYYLYQCPCLDKVKQKFVYYQYESKPVEKQECSNLFIQTLFILLTKGLALGILIALMLLSEGEVRRVYNEYQFGLDTQADKETLAALEEQGRSALAGAIVNCILAGLMVMSVFINCFALGHPLKDVAPRRKMKTHEKQKYGLLGEDAKE